MSGLGNEYSVPTLASFEDAWVERKVGKWEFSLDVKSEGIPPVPCGLVVGARPGPTGLVVAGIHGTELLMQDVAQLLLLRLQPCEVRGAICVVLCADVLAAECGMPTFNPRDGQNLNRVWPGRSDGSVTECLAHAIYSQIVAKVDYVVDLHGGEWTEEALPVSIVQSGGDANVDEGSMRLAHAARLGYIELHQAATQGEKQSTIIAQAVRDGKAAVALEIGGQGKRDDVVSGLSAVCRILVAAGSLEGIEDGSGCRVLDGSTVVRSPSRGVLVSLVEVGESVKEGAEVARVQAFGGSNEIGVVSSRSGVVVLRSVARVIKRGGLVVKIGHLEVDRLD